MVGEIYSHELMSDDPYFFHKDSLRQSNNYLHDKTREDKDRLDTIVYFTISLFLAFASSFFVEKYQFLSLLVLGNILTFILIKSVKTYNEKRKIFWENRSKMKKSYREWGLPWKD